MEAQKGKLTRLHWIIVMNCEPDKGENVTETQRIEVPLQILHWSNWIPWKRLEEATDGPGGSRDVPRVPGVYEVKRSNQSIERMHIGQTTNLNRRIIRQLIPGVRHSTGWRIHTALQEGVEDKCALLVRWAPTEYPCCVEEVLKKRYLTRFGEKPEYNKQ